MEKLCYHLVSEKVGSRKFVRGTFLTIKYPSSASASGLAVSPSDSSLLGSKLLNSSFPSLLNIIGGRSFRYLNKG